MRPLPGRDSSNKVKGLSYLTMFFDFSNKLTTPFNPLLSKEGKEGRLDTLIIGHFFWLKETSGEEI